LLPKNLNSKFNKLKFLSNNSDIPEISVERPKKVHDHGKYLFVQIIIQKPKGCLSWFQEKEVKYKNF
jgi:hypothetical protein